MALLRQRSRVKTGFAVVGSWPLFSRRLDTTVGLVYLRTRKKQVQCHWHLQALYLVLPSSQTNKTNSGIKAS